jgi:hypothetical protein
MEHIAPMTHPAPELDVVTEQQMRRPSVVSNPEKPQIMERTWGFAARTDSTVTYEEYVYWARIEREMEVDENKVHEAEHASPLKTSIKNVFSRSGRKQAKAEQDARLQTLQQLDEKRPAAVTTGSDGSQNAPIDAMHVTDHEWRTAARALRTASWGQMFFLITTDILGWSGAPYVPLTRCKPTTMLTLQKVRLRFRRLRHRRCSLLDLRYLRCLGWLCHLEDFPRPRFVALPYAEFR